MQLPVVGRSNIIDAANMLSQHNRAVKVDPNYMVIRITGEHASFSVPGTRAESVTYDIPTFAALKGAIDNAYWHPGIETIPAVLYVHNKIIKRRVTVNGSNDMVSRNQRSIECLEDVNYSVVVYLVEMTSIQESMSLAKYRQMLIRNISNGVGYEPSFLGKRMCMANLQVIDEKDVGCTQPITEDLGNMRFASDYTDKYNPIPICRHMKIKNGVVNLLEGEWYRCYANV